MIQLTAINGKQFILNAEHIEKLEQGRETVIILINGKKYIVTEKAEEIIDKVLEYKRKIFTFDIQGAAKR